MNKMIMHPALRLSVVAAALLSAFGAARAQEVDELIRLSKPESTVQLGAGYVDADNRRYGMYVGTQDAGLYGIANLGLVSRDEATGTWLKLRGRNLGLDSREIRFDHLRQGDWGYFLEYSETPRFSQYVVNTGLRGIGTNNLTVSPNNRRDVTLSTKREKASLGFSKSLGAGFDVQVRFANEEKDGTRLFGRGTTGGSGNFNFLAEPINSTTQQLEATLGYVGDRLQLQGGYYGSLFTNHNTSLNIAGGGAALNAGAGTFSPIALPPGNEAHQLFVTGAYDFARTTRGTFKAAYSKATQNESFVALPPGGANISGRNDLGGEVDTTLLLLGLTSRPLPKLSLSANLRHEDRDDQTPVAQYVTATGAATHDGKNEVRSFRSTSGKVDAGYQLPAGFRAVAGLEHEIKERSASPVRVVSSREKTEETALRLELRRSMSETVNGALALIHSKRDGSDFLFTRRLDGTNGSNLIAPLYLADRERDKVRFSADWTPLESLGFQVVYEESWDTYGTRFDLGLGARDGRGQLYSVDANYAVSDNWQVTGWASYSNTATEQRSGLSAAASPATPAAGVPAQVVEAGLRDRSNALGLGVKGRIMGKLDVGADLQFSRDRSEYGLLAVTGAAVSSLPDVRYETTTLRVFGRYPVQKNAGVQVDFVHDRRVVDDWTWASWTYKTADAISQDGTTVRQASVQKTNFVGVSGYYRWW